MIKLAKQTFLLGTLIGLGFNYHTLMLAADVNWTGWLLCYVICFVFLKFYILNTEHAPQQAAEIPAGVNPDHLNALYKQSMIVERNAQKASLVFTKQLDYVKRILVKAKNLTPGDDFDLTHQNLVEELDVLEHHIEKLLEEMKKNVKLGEKLQQSVANIDPEIGVL